MHSVGIVTTISIFSVEVKKEKKKKEREKKERGGKNEKTEGKLMNFLRVSLIDNFISDWLNELINNYAFLIKLISRIVVSSFPL